ncbi:DNA polymerase IV [Marinomonas sp. M1K-6]|uniref:DNA polymerase IV n=1 Tax=Marinomonas profundi TaxID=2726122 RepID=A0A847R7P4_9GAMM|nr:DNA polymerase IV [Marinomonas profundi]NLQ18096.1 DNA polymerase IV [Marinomonas profundi]UDV04826.1 DNA polymerase IV [Marinomonas profundi]
MSVDRKIIHIDADCFYAAIEMRDNPRLRGIPIAIGGSASRRGVLSTANYAAREFGVRSAMPTSVAKRLCPSLLVLPGRMDKYREASKQMQAIFREFTDIIEPLSLDEAYLDVTDSACFQGSATRMAEEIRARILSEIGITVSAGVATNKFIAKVASDWDKPDGLTVVTPEKQFAFVSAVPVKFIAGIGRVAQDKLALLGVFSCADLQQLDFALLQKHFGSMAFRLSQFALGIDDRPVTVSRERKSLSVEHTFAKDLSDLRACQAVLPMLLADLKTRMAGRNFDTQLSKYYLKVKFDDFKQTTIERPIRHKLSDDVFSVLLAQAYARFRRPVRLIGVGYRLSPPKPHQLALVFES